MRTDLPMEIERKFLIAGFPDELPELRRAVVEQGYLATDPVVRIRKTSPSQGAPGYMLCFKGEGTLVRREIELPLTEMVFEELCALLKKPMIHKEFRVYALPGGLQLECSRVSFSADGKVFWYAEVEFESIAQANAFFPPPFLLREVTEDPSFTMRALWERMKLTNE